MPSLALPHVHSSARPHVLEFVILAAALASTSAPASGQGNPGGSIPIAPAFSTTTWTLPTLSHPDGDPTGPFREEAVDDLGAQPPEYNNPWLHWRLTAEMIPPPASGLPSFELAGFFIGSVPNPGVGDRWQLRFTPPNIQGLWTAEITFERGPDINVSSDAAGMGTVLATWTKELQVIAPSALAPGFASKGFVLAYREPGVLGARYLRHSDGTTFLKGGIDSPENFLAYRGFTDMYYGGMSMLTDADIDAPGPAGMPDLGNGVPQFIHEYEAMAGVHQPNNDPVWEVAAEPGVNQARGICGAIRYLSSEHVNSLYMLPMNLGGDGRDTHPFIGSPKAVSDASGDAPASPETLLHYRVRRMREWNQVFEFAMKMGIQLQFVLAEEEEPNIEWLGAHDSRERRLYHKNLVAMFGHCHALKWNLCEENDMEDMMGHSDQFNVDELTSMALWIQRWDKRDFDPLAAKWIGHPIAVHNAAVEEIALYQQIRDQVSDADWWLDITSMQIHAGESFGSSCGGTAHGTQDSYNQLVEGAQAMFLAGSSGTGSSPRYVVIDVDEPGHGIADELTGPSFCSSMTESDRRRRALFDVYLSGGGIEWFAGFFENRNMNMPNMYNRDWGGGDFRLENFANRELIFRSTFKARERFQSIESRLGIPLRQLAHDDGLVTGALDDVDYGTPEVLAAREEVYIVYYPLVVDAGGSFVTGTLTLHAPTGPTPQDYVGTWYSAGLQMSVVGNPDVFQIPPGSGTHSPVIAGFTPTIITDLVYIAVATP